MRCSHLAAIGLALLVVACSDDPTPTNPNVGPTARLRAVNAVSNGDPISVAVDGNVAIAGLAYLSSSDYVGVPAGSHSVELRSATGGSTLGSASVTFQKDSAYTVVATGSGAQADPLVAIDTGVVPAAGKVKFRVIHAAPDAPPLDVFLTPFGADLAGAFPYVTPFTYGVGTSDDFPGYVEREPGTWQVRLTDRGTTDVLLDSGPLEAAAGQVYSVILAQSDTLAGRFLIQVVRDR